MSEVVSKPTKEEKAAEKAREKRREAMRSAVAAFNERKGRTLVTTADRLHDTGFQSTGVVTLDYYLHGWKRGTIAELRGKPGTGKSTLLFRAISQCDTALILAVEGSKLSREWGETCGVDWKGVSVEMPETIDDAFDAADALVRDNVFDLIAIDALGAAKTREDVKRIAGDDPQMQADLARVMNRRVRNLNAKMQPGDLHEADSYCRTTVLILNHFYAGGFGNYGTQEVASGGRGKDFLSIRQLDLTAPKGERIQAEEVDALKAVTTTNQNKKKEKAFIGQRCHAVFHKESLTGQMGNETFFDIVSLPTEKWPEKGVSNSTMLQLVVRHMLNQRPPLEEIVAQFDHYYTECFLARHGMKPPVLMRRT